jgi:peptide/nickel transport system substrate-binding protein
MMAGAEFGIVSEDEVNALGGIEKATMNPVMGSGKYLFKE